MYVVDKIIDDNNEKKRKKMSSEKTKFNRISQWMGFIGCILSIIIAVFNLYSKIKPSQHNVIIAVPKVDINEDNIQFALVCDNKGDYDEIVTDVSLYFVENYQSNNMNNVHIAQSNELILLPKKSTVKNILVGKLDLNRIPFNILLVNDKTYTIVLNTSLVKNDNKIVTNELLIGMIKMLKNSNNDFVSGDIQFITQYKKVDFSKSKPVLTITSFPRTIEYDTFELSIVK